MGDINWKGYKGDTSGDVFFVRDFVFLPLENEPTEDREDYTLEECKWMCCDETAWKVWLHKSWFRPDDHPFFQKKSFFMKAEDGAARLVFNREKSNAIWGTNHLHHVGVSILMKRQRALHGDHHCEKSDKQAKEDREQLAVDRVVNFW